LATAQSSIGRTADEHTDPIEDQKLKPQGPFAGPSEPTAASELIDASKCRGNVSEKTGLHKSLAPIDKDRAMSIVLRTLAD
jgi:hypothetical protein